MLLAWNTEKNVGAGEAISAFLIIPPARTLVKADHHTSDIANVAQNGAILQAESDCNM